MIFEKSRLRVGFIGKYQVPLFMLIREYYINDGTVTYATPIFTINGPKWLLNLNPHLACKV